MKLENKTALITGAGSGLGRAIALRFANEGASIVVADFNAASGEAVAQEIKANGGEAIAIATDVSDAKAVTKLFAAVDAQCWSIDILVNNAGQGGQLGFAHEQSDEAWHAIIATHLHGTFYCTRAAITRMLPGGGAIINLGSVAGLRGMPMGASYSAAKGAIISFTKAIAQEVARFGIRVNCIAPGWVETPILDHLPDKLKDTMAQNVPLGRIGQPEEIAAVALFLAAAESSYIIGQVISPNGGSYA